MTNKVKLTPEQKDELVKFFQNNDFTANMELDRKYNFEGEQAEIFARTKKMFGESPKIRCKTENEKLLKGLSGQFFGER